VSELTVTNRHDVIVIGGGQARLAIGGPLAHKAIVRDPRRRRRAPRRRGARGGTR
jgi:hypothetical protein